jgi:hypothetical protein
MIVYAPESQLSLDMFKYPFERELNKENRLVKLASLIPGDSFAAIYGGKPDPGTGRKNENIRTQSEQLWSSSTSLTLTTGAPYK